jgi:Zn-dependent protease
MRLRFDFSFLACRTSSKTRLLKGHPMIELSLRGMRLRFDFSFFAVIALFACLDVSGYGLLGLSACLVHESGHLAAMVIEHHPPAMVTFYGGGIKISGHRTSRLSPFVLCAGSGANLLAFAVTWAASSGTSLFPLIFAMMNLVIAVFNLLPIGYLDGARLAELLFIRLFHASKIHLLILLTQTLFTVAALLLAVKLIFSGAVNASFALIAGYLMLDQLIMEWEEG